MRVAKNRRQATGNRQQAMGEAEREPEREREREREPERADERAEICEENVRAVRVGHGANCSSVGSVIDTLFLGAAFGGAILAAVFAAMKEESVTIVGGDAKADDARRPEDAT